MPPVAVRSAPADRKNAIKELFDFRGGAIAQRRQVGDQSSVPEQHRNGEVGRDRKNVPEQRAAEVWPDAVIVRQRRQIPRHPNAPDVHAGENRGANHREKCHCFRGTIDRSAPLLSQQVKNGRNQSAGMPDADSEHEISNVTSPADGMVQSPGADPGGNLVVKTEKTETGNSRGEGKGNPPPPRRAILYRAGDSLRNPAITPPVQYQRRASQRLLGRSDLLALSQFWCCGGAVHIHSSSRAKPRDLGAKSLRFRRPDCRKTALTAACACVSPSGRKWKRRSVLCPSL